MITRKGIWLIVGITSFILLGVVAFLLIDSLRPRQVTITYNDVRGATVKLFKVDSTEALHDLDDERQVGKEVRDSVKSGEAISLQRGAYVISVSGESVEKKQYPLEVVDNTQKAITITYSQTYLDTLLKETEPSILASLRKDLPILDSLYAVHGGKLYHNGDWYAARLRYIGTDPDNRDALKVIMKKAGDTWELATKTPEIIVTYPEYPSIPRDIIKDINSDEPVEINPVGQ